MDDSSHRTDGAINTNNNNQKNGDDDENNDDNKKHANIKDICNDKYDFENKDGDNDNTK